MIITNMPKLQVVDSTNTKIHFFLSLEHTHLPDQTTMYYRLVQAYVETYRGYILLARVNNKLTCPASTYVLSTDKISAGSTYVYNAAHRAIKECIGFDSTSTTHMGIIPASKETNNDFIYVYYSLLDIAKLAIEPNFSWCQEMFTIPKYELGSRIAKQPNDFDPIFLKVYSYIIRKQCEVE
jgi:hypothetical protein